MGCPETVYVIGGGHVGLAVCQALVPLDFRIVVLDHRADVATMHQNTWAHEKITTPFTELMTHIRPGDRSYVTIVSTSFDSDATALETLIAHPFRYLGLMGSAAKIRHIFQHVRERGITEEQLAGVRAPIGVPIINCTPAEIAISIVADLIHTRHGGAPL